MLRQISRIAAVIAGVLAVALVVTVSPAHAGEVDDYPAPDCSVSVDDDSPTAGDTITITGENWPPGSTVTIVVGGAEVGTTTAGDDGTWEFEYTIPSDAEAGTYEVSATGCEGANVGGTTITVGAAPAALPRTGSSSTEPLVRTGAVLIAAGAVLVYAVRRRHQAAAG
jgi:alpha-L-fucosidase